jgi:hypothetical protein
MRPVEPFDKDGVGNKARSIPQMQLEGRRLEREAYWRRAIEVERHLVRGRRAGRGERCGDPSLYGAVQMPGRNQLHLRVARKDVRHV